MTGAKERRLGTVLAAVFLLTQLYLIFLRRHDTMDLEIYPNTKPSLNYRVDFAIGQTFKSGLNRLNRIDIMLGTHHKTLGGEVILRLREWPFPADPAADVRTVRVRGAEIKDNLYQTFSFPPIPDSKGKSYAFEILAADPDPEAPGCVWINEADIYPAGDLLIKGKVNGGDCTFRTYSSRTIAESVGRITRRKPGPFGSPLFFWLVLLALEASLAALLRHLPGMFAGTGPDRQPPADARRP